MPAVLRDALGIGAAVGPSVCAGPREEFVFSSLWIIGIAVAFFLLRETILHKSAIDSQIAPRLLVAGVLLATVPPAVFTLQTVGPGGIPQGQQNYRVQVQTQDDRLDFVAAFVDKPWVQNEVPFRRGADAPRKYIVALGDNDVSGESAIDTAARYLATEVDYYISKHSQSIFPPSQYESLARVVAISRTRDKFTQSFDTKVDGSRAEIPVRGEAILIDCTRSNLDRAINAANLGMDYQANDVVGATAYTESVTAIRRSPSGELTLPLLATVLACCWVLKGVSRFFDGAPDG